MSMMVMERKELDRALNLKRRKSATTIGISCHLDLSQRVGLSLSRC